MGDEFTMEVELKARDEVGGPDAETEYRLDPDHGILRTNLRKLPCCEPGL